MLKNLIVSLFVGMSIAAYAAPIEMKPVSPIDLLKIPSIKDDTEPLRLACETLRGTGFLMLNLGDGTSLVVKISCPTNLKKDT